MVRLVLFQPDIPQNFGTMLRMSACLDVGVDVIEPCGFPLDDRKMRRAGMDYLDHVSLQKHLSWEHFCDYRQQLSETPRLILLTTKVSLPYVKVCYRPNDMLMVGRESAGVPDNVATYADERVTIPMVPAMRSMNVATAAAMVLGEALQQTKGFYHAERPFT